MTGLKLSQDLSKLAKYLADDIKTLRGITHNHFDWLWQSGAMTRTDAYLWLAETMCLPKEKAHIALFNKEQCIAVQNAVNNWIWDKV